MAGLHHWDWDEGGSTQRHWRQHPPPIDGWDHGWAESQHEPTPYGYALPYRPRSRDIQWPDGGHALEPSASHRPWPSEDMRTRESSPSRPRGRSATLSHRSAPKDPTARAHREQYARRARPAARSRSTSTSESSSVTSASSRTSEDDSEDSGMVTPKSAHEDRVTPESDCSSTASSDSASSSTDSSDDSAPPPMTRRANKGRTGGKLKAPAQAVLPPQAKSHHRHDRRRSQRELAMLEVESEPAPEPEKTARRRHKHQSAAKISSTRAPHRYRDNRREIRPASSSKRSTRKKYYEPGPSHSDKESLARSQTTQSTRSKSSSKRSSTLVGRTVPSHISRASHRSAKPSAFVECIACRNDETPRKKTVKLSCGHRMCRSCLKRVFRLSTKDSQQMPPKCCTDRPIDVQHVDALFDDEFKRTWNYKLAEFSASNRIYCPRKGCGEWIGPSRVRRLKDGRKKATCGRCRTELCVACKGDWHDSEDCPGEESSLQLLQVAPRIIRKRCSPCKCIVSIEEDSNRMPCCGAQFCMVCGAKWKTCECPWFSCEELEEEEEEEEDDDEEEEEEEEIEHIRMARGPATGGRKERASRGSRARSHRNQPPTYAEERSRRRRQEKDDEKLARKLQYGHDEEDDDDYTGRYGEIVAVGNSAGHHMNESYRRPQQAHMAPPMAPLAHPIPFERAATADYVAGVNKARGLRTDAMEARLAERFSESRHNQHPGRRAFTHPFPPMHPMHPMQAPPMSPMSVGPLPPGPPSMPMIRRHTMEGDDYSTQSLRLTERMKPRHARYNHSFDSGAYSTTGRLQHDRESSSKLAGLTGIGRGAHRVDEWREFVPPVPPPPPETVG